MPLIALFLVAAFAVPSAVSAQAPPVALTAPTRLYTEPAVYLLLRLPGDSVTVRYTPGSLDRAANLQTRLEMVTRSFKRWIGLRLDVDVYVLSRDEWRQAGYDVPYGVPVRIGRRALAGPAEGDSGTVELWADLLKGILPAVAGNPMRGTPQQTATMILADFMSQLLICEILIDEANLAGDELWVRSLMTHVGSVDFVRRYEDGRLRDLDTMYELLSRDAGPKAFSSRDYNPDLTLREWLWFQAQFHRGAQAILAKTGKGALQKMKKLRKKTDGVLSGERLLRQFDGLEDWHRESFTAVSLRR